MTHERGRYIRLPQPLGDDTAVANRVRNARECRGTRLPRFFTFLLITLILLGGVGVVAEQITH